MYQIETMTISEYYLRLEAYQLQQIDKQKDLATQSWFNQTVKSTTGSSKHPKPKFKTLTDFYDAQQEENKVKKFFDPDYKPVVESEQEKKIKRAKLFAKRQEEWMKKHKKGG